MPARAAAAPRVLAATVNGGDWRAGAREGVPVRLFGRIPIDWTAEAAIQRFGTAAGAIFRDLQGAGLATVRSSRVFASSGRGTQPYLVGMHLHVSREVADELQGRVDDRSYLPLPAPWGGFAVAYIDSSTSLREVHLQGVPLNMTQQCLRSFLQAHHIFPTRLDDVVDPITGLARGDLIVMEVANKTKLPSEIVVSDEQGAVLATIRVRPVSSLPPAPGAPAAAGGSAGGYAGAVRGGVPLGPAAAAAVPPTPPAVPPPASPPTTSVPLAGSAARPPAARSAPAPAPPPSAAAAAGVVPAALPPAAHSAPAPAPPPSAAAASGVVPAAQPPAEPAAAVPPPSPSPDMAAVLASPSPAGLAAPLPPSPPSPSSSSLVPLGAATRSRSATRGRHPEPRGTSLKRQCTVAGKNRFHQLSGTDGMDADLDVVAGRSAAPGDVDMPAADGSSPSAGGGC
ncbi:hypothetical protein D9Q98_004351 [Chlorella vulgaris]|uniref:Uncharacterized protein n=1 Tax=Chlorella vulgaris TaxID=3077 RepID=A0A9D4TPX0_CHLVU|nr:hypothetical protein D9Q98_004351 [Chlorella vulgaris]